MSDSEELSKIEARFHDLILSRVEEGRLERPRNLPLLSLAMLGAEEPQWFPVEGMHGGFSYQLVRRRDRLVLISESWSRVYDGSGQRHIVSWDETILEEEGFV